MRVHLQMSSWVCPMFYGGGIVGICPWLSVVLNLLCPQPTPPESFSSFRLGLFNEFSQSCGVFFPDACTTAHHSNEKSVCYKGRKSKGWIWVGWATGTGRGLWVAAQRSSGGTAGGRWAWVEPFEKAIQLISSLYISLSCRPASPLETSDFSYLIPYIPSLSRVQFLQYRIV